MTRMMPADRKRWRRENKRERLEGYPHIWVATVDGEGRRDWTLTVTTDDHTYVRAASGHPYQWGDEATFVQELHRVEDFAPAL